MKLYLRPNGSEIDPGTGIGQVCIAQLKYLPDFGIQVVDDVKRAEVVACHTQGFDLPRIDVLHCHGLYWSGDGGSGNYLGWHSEANKRIVDAARRAKIITVPSDWVAEPFRRDMRIEPRIIGHGIEFSEWQAMENGGFVLWNKNRPNDVCDPTPAYNLAQRGIPVRATFAPEGRPNLENLVVTGRLPFATMKDMVQAADVYLATTKETFGIGTIEAMACGVPVLGWNWGGTADIVTHQIDGYLCQPGDIDGLEEGYRWIQAHRAELSEAARETAKRYAWPEIIKLYVEAYQEASVPDPVGVSVVIPCHNYGRFVNEAIYSVIHQTRKPDEIIVVDDGSTDDSKEVIQSFLAAGITAIFQDNQGVAAARNNGIAHAHNPFIICLDADDRLAPRFIATLLPAMVKDRGLGIAYAGIGLIHGEGEAMRYTAWPPDFDWQHMTVPHVPPNNTIPSACMFRRSMWERAGGYRQQYAPGEDTEFWVRGLSVGFTAKKITDESLFEYRVHQGSESRNKKYVDIDTWMPWMSDGLQPFAAPSNEPPQVRSYSEPLVSVIIPVSPAHVELLPAAVESVMGQDFRDWEIIAVLDGIDEREFKNALRRYPFVRQLNTSGYLGAGFARNLGLAGAKAPLVMFLDADDYLMPGILTKWVDAWHSNGGRFVYTDWMTDEAEVHKAPDYDHLLYKKALYHAVTTIMATEQARMIGGFDVQMQAWEDWDYYLKAAVNGVHGAHLPEVGLVYRVDSGTRRKTAAAKREELKKLVIARYVDYLTGEKAMSPCCGGSRAAQQILAAKRAMGASTTPEEAAEKISTDTVRIEYYGPRSGAVTYIGKSGNRYAFGNGTMNRYNDVKKEDASLFLSMEFFRLVKRPEPAQQAAPPVAVAVQAAPVKAEAKAPEPTPAPVKVEAVPAPKKRTRKAKA